MKSVRIVLQKVKSASVRVENKTVGEISHGFLLLLGVTHEDTEKDAEWLAEKILKLRLFEDPSASSPRGDSAEPGQGSFMEKNIREVGGGVLVVSQFTVYGNCKKGTRPSFTDSARPIQAEKLYNYFVDKLRQAEIAVETGKFAAKMEVELINDGPVTLIVDSK